MKNILLENMLRFGTKNINSIKLKDLLEQVTEGAEQPYMSLKLEAQRFIGDTIKAATKTTKNAELERELESEYSEVYTQLITNFTTADTYITPRIWYLKLNQDARKLFLNSLRTYLEKNKKLKFVIKLAQGKIDITKKEPDEISTDPIILPASVDLSGNDVFIDNESVVTNAIKSAIDVEVSKLASLIKDNPSAKWKLKRLTVAASASRFRNTKNAANLTWAQLSEARANNAAKYFVNAIEPLGIDVSSNFELITGGGYNGDGTSGPNPGKDPDGNQYAISSNGRFKDLVKPGYDINEKGAPLASKDEYDRFKFILISADIVPYDKQNPVYPEPGFFKSRNYTMAILPKGTNTVKLSYNTKEFIPKQLEKRNQVINKCLKCSFTGEGLKKRLVKK